MNIRDIARLANVTPSTVSKVLNNYPDISEATKKHVLNIIAENQYDPKANSRASKTAPSFARVGLVVESVYNAVYSKMEDILSMNLHNAGFSIVSFHDNFFSQDKHDKICELKAFMERDKMCALIYLGGNFAGLSEEEFRSLPCPTIFVNTVLPEDAREDTFSSVQVSHYDTAFTQMRYLIEKGHRDICTVISSEADNSVYGLRVEAYRNALRQNALEHNLGFFVESDYLSEKAHARVTELLLSHPEITAVCCLADIVTPGVIRGIHDAGKIPGRDVQVISFDGMKETEYLIPSVTTFAQPLTEMASYIDRLLIGLVNRQQQHQHITFRPSFQKRESC